MDVDVRDYEEAGADCVLIKPMRMEHLEKLLQYCALYGCQSAKALRSESMKAMVTVSVKDFVLASSSPSIRTVG